MTPLQRRRVFDLLAAGAMAVAILAAILAVVAIAI